MTLKYDVEVQMPDGSWRVVGRLRPPGALMIRDQNDDTGPRHISGRDWVRINKQKGQST